MISFPKPLVSSSIPKHSNVYILFRIKHTAVCSASVEVTNYTEKGFGSVATVKLLMAKKGSTV